MPDVGRNQPCPCGSGKKYKRCCLAGTDGGAALAKTPRLHALDRELMTAIHRWAEHAEPDIYEWTLGMNPITGEDNRVFDDVTESALATVTGQGDVTLAHRFLAARGPRLLAHEVEWLGALLEAWLGLWEVTEIRPGRGVQVRDIVSGEVREVIDVGLAGSGRKRSIVCGRVVTFEGLSVFVCIHPHALRPSQADAVLDAFLLPEDGPLPHAPELLRGENANELLRCWHDACVAAANPELPRLTNRDGDEMQETIDRLSFEVPDRAEIILALQRLDDFVTDDSDDGQVHMTLVRPKDKTVLGSVRVGKAALTLETNSEARGDALLGRVQPVLGSLVTLGERHRLDVQDMVASRMGSPAPADVDLAPQGPEIDAMLLQFKTEQYATWPDTPLPMLGGKTPREGMDEPRMKRLILDTLEDIASAEQHFPEGQRYDVGILRRALGI